MPREGIVFLWEKSGRDLTNFVPNSEPKSKSCDGCTCGRRTIVHNVDGMTNLRHLVLLPDRGGGIGARRFQTICDRVPQVDRGTQAPAMDSRWI